MTFILLFFFYLVIFLFFLLFFDEGAPAGAAEAVDLSEPPTAVEAIVAAM